MESNLENHMKALVQISFIDGKFDEPEKNHVYAIGKANNLPENKIDEIMKNVVESKEYEDITYEGLMKEERFDFLYDIIQLMKIDGEVFLSEIKYCERIAEKLGFDKKVVKNMAARIYSDPAITADRNLVMREAEKYLIQ